MSTWPVLLALPALVAHLPSWTQECAGCHSAAREAPPARFSFGVGKWNDAQCYGCHAEMASMGKNLLEKGEDNRAFGLPYSFNAMKRFSKGHGPFLGAPREPQWKVGGIERIDAARLPDFLAHPPVHADGASMIPFPHSMQKVERALPASEVEKGERLFAEKCAGCHSSADGSAKRGPFHLALFTADWLFSYAQGADPKDGTRSMPRVTLSRGEARAIAASLENERRTQVAQVDAAFETDTREAKRLMQSKTKEVATSPFSLVSFLREGGCVHCHDGTHRAARAFLASPLGVTSYVERRGAEGLLTRLLMRQSEVMRGIVGSKPGMPASLAPLPLERIRALAQWIATTCSTLKGNTTCAH